MKCKEFCIYVVDDDDDDRYIISEVLEPYSDCPVTFFIDGESLLADLSDCSQEKLPALILLDLHMPRVDGFEIIQTIRANPDLCFIPILVMSGTRSEQIVRKAYQFGANAFMSKPNSFPEMTELFRSTYNYWLKTVHIPANS